VRLFQARTATLNPQKNLQRAPGTQDGETWLHINWYYGGGVTARSFGVFNVAGPLGPAYSSAGYALEVGNATLVEALQRHATVATAQPFLMYMGEDVTLHPRADWPAGGLVIRRPVYFVGWSDVRNSVDFGMCAGCARLEGAHANVTFDSLALENLSFGDVGAPASDAFSIIAAHNMWFFNATRREPRIVARNCTLVLPLRKEVELMRYWSSAYNAPDRAQWLRGGALKVTAWEARVGGDEDALMVDKYVGAGALMQWTVLTSAPQIAKPIMLPDWCVF
jgi:hypothetical protein